MSSKRLSVVSIQALKGKAPIVCLTAYTAPFGKMLDSHCDLLLVGDSLGMVLYGMDSTLPVSLDMMINHGRAVVRASHHACVVVDLPFGTYQSSPADAFLNAAKVLQETGCQAIKLEGGTEMAATIEFLTQRGIPVMGHIGLRPQSVHIYGSYKTRGTQKEEAKQILADALALQEAGAFALVAEHIPEALAQTITKKLKIPVIGIGASEHCDGQILVTDDMLGLSGFKPSFVKSYAQLSTLCEKAVRQYATDVRNNYNIAKKGSKV